MHTSAFTVALLFSGFVLGQPDGRCNCGFGLFILYRVSLTRGYFSPLGHEAISMLAELF